MTLRKKLILLTSGMSVLLLALAFGLVRYAVKGHIGAEAREQVQASRLSLERELQKALQSYQLQGELIANDESLKQTLLKNDPEAAAAHLNNAYQNTPAEYVILLNDKGEVVADVRQQFRKGSRLPISAGLLAPDSGDTGFLYIDGTLLAAAVVQIRHEEHIIGSMIVGAQATPGRIADLETVTRAKITIVLPKASKLLASLNDVDAAEVSRYTDNCAQAKLGTMEQVEIGGASHVIAVQKLADVRGDTLGCFAVSRSMAPQLLALRHIDRWMLIACLVMAALAGGGAWAISYGIVERVRRLTRMALQIAAGDLSETDPPDTRQDEIGQTARAFHGMLHSLRMLAEAADRMAKGDLTGRIEVDGQVADAFNRMLEGQRAVVRQIATASVQLTAAAAAIYTAAQRQESAAADNALGIEHVSLTVESLLGSASHIAESARGVLANAERTKETTDGMSRRIAELNGHTNRIAELLEVIREIADRSDLLALNASLEATRAGEAGRAFALVAGEMRRLAERVTASVQDVKSLLSDVRGSGAATVAATDEGRDLAESTTESARQITRVTEEQRTATEQMLVSMQGISTVLLEWVAAAQEARASAGVLKQEADRLAGVVGDFQLDDSGRDTERGRDSERGYDGERTRDSDRPRDGLHVRDSERSRDSDRGRDGERLREGGRGHDGGRVGENP